jgi:hypothetical protein
MTRKKDEAHLKRNRWLKESLEALSHQSPDSLSSVFRTHNTVANDELHSLSLWLEERAIRIWDLRSRDCFLKKADVFWNAGGFEKYLTDLEFPIELSLEQGNADRDMSGTHHVNEWRDDDKIRSRIIVWLIQCAINEVFADTNKSIDGETVERTDDRANEVSSGTVDETDTGQKIDQLNNLGFTTATEKIDPYLTALRMYHLLELREMQDTISAGLSDMQKLTVKQPKRQHKKES